MKKIIFILGSIALSAAFFLSTFNTYSDTGDLSLTSLKMINEASAEPSQGGGQGAHSCYQSIISGGGSWSVRDCATCNIVSDAYSWSGASTCQ